MTIHIQPYIYDQTTYCGLHLVKAGNYISVIHVHSVDENTLCKNCLKALKKEQP